MAVQRAAGGNTILKNMMMPVDAQMSFSTAAFNEMRALERSLIDITVKRAGVPSPCMFEQGVDGFGMPMHRCQVTCGPVTHWSQWHNLPQAAHLECLRIWLEWNNSDAEVMAVFQFHMSQLIPPAIGLLPGAPVPVLSVQAAEFQTAACTTANMHPLPLAPAPVHWTQSQTHHDADGLRADAQPFQPSAGGEAFDWAAEAEAEAVTGADAASMPSGRGEASKAGPEAETEAEEDDAGGEVEAGAALYVSNLPEESAGAGKRSWCSELRYQFNSRTMGLCKLKDVEVGRVGAKLLYGSKQDAESARRMLDGKTLHGRKLEVQLYTAGMDLGVYSSSVSGASASVSGASVRGAGASVSGASVSGTNVKAKAFVLPTPMAAPPPPPPSNPSAREADQLVSCPACGMAMRNEEVYAHLDVCWGSCSAEEKGPENYPTQLQPPPQPQQQHSKAPVPKPPQSQPPPLEPQQRRYAAAAAAANTLTAEEMALAVCCPVCDVMVRMRDLNAHLDAGCQPTREPASSGTSQPSGSGQANTRRQDSTPEPEAGPRRPSPREAEQIAAKSDFVAQVVKGTPVRLYKELSTTKRNNAQSGLEPCVSASNPSASLKPLPAVVSPDEPFPHARLASPSLQLASCSRVTTRRRHRTLLRSKRAASRLEQAWPIRH